MIYNNQHAVLSLLKVLLLPGIVTVLIASSPGPEPRNPGIHSGRTGEMSNIPAADTLKWYHGTIKVKMPNGSFVTPFGMDIVFEQTESDTTITHTGTTNHGGRYYVKTLNPGRYKVSVRHNRSTVYTDSMTVQPSETYHLDEIVIDIKQLEQKKQSG